MFGDDIFGDLASDDNNLIGKKRGQGDEDKNDKKDKKGNKQYARSVNSTIAPRVTLVCGAAVPRQVNERVGQVLLGCFIPMVHVFTQPMCDIPFALKTPESVVYRITVFSTISYKTRTPTSRRTIR